MLRLRTTTPNGKVFLGPFVYDLDEKQAKRKLRKLNWLIPKGPGGRPLRQAGMEFIEVDKFPEEAIYDWRVDTHDVNLALTGLIELVMKKWRKYDNEEDIDEVEEGSIV